MGGKKMGVEAWGRNEGQGGIRWEIGGKLKERN